MSTISSFVYKSDNDIFETTQRNIFTTKKFTKKNSPKKYNSIDECYEDLQLVKKKFTWISWHVTDF
jgi:hypothetical protein